MHGLGEYNAQLTIVTRGKLVRQVRAPFNIMEIGKTG